MKKNVIYVAIAIMSWVLLYSFIDIYYYNGREYMTSNDAISLDSSANTVVPLGTSTNPAIPLGTSTNPAISSGSPPNYDSSTNPAISLGSSTKRGNRKKFASFNKNNKIENNTKEIADLKGKMTNFNNNNISLLNELQTNISKSIDKNKQHMNL